MAQPDSQMTFSTDERIADLQEHIKTLETKMAYMESRATGHHTRHDSVTARTEMTDDGLDSDQGAIRPLKNATAIFEVNYCNFTQFKNRFSEDEGRYAIDVLVSGPLLDQEIREESKLREQRAGYGSHWEQYQQLQKQQSIGGRKSAAKAMASALKTANNISSNNSDAIRAAQSSDTWISRIRLQCPALLKVMASVQGETWSFRPRTYFRPFSSLIFFHSQMKKRLAELEERWSHFINPDGSTIPLSTTGAVSYDSSDPFREDLHEPQQEPVDNSPLALLAMRCYVSFMDTKIMPEYHRFERLNEQDAARLGPATQIPFSDLGHLFRTGEYVYRDLDSDTPGRRDSRLGKRLWRCYGMHVADTRLSVPRDHGKYNGAAEVEDGYENAQFRARRSSDNTSTTSSSTPSGNNTPTAITPNQNAPFNPHAFVIRTYMIEYTGDGFCTVTKDFSILPYKGLRQITSLPIYPLRFAPGGSDNSFLSSAIEVGERVLHSIRVKHGTYNAWTVMRTPEATLVRDVNGIVMKHPEHVNSEILVDFAEAFQVCPAWKPRRAVLRRRNVEQLTESDDFSILWWDGPDRNKLLGETSEVVPIRTGVGMWAQNHFVSEGDRFLVQLADNDHRGVQTGRECLRKEDMALISPRVYAYVFQERKFAQLDVRYFVDSVGANKDALNFLRIPQKVKHMIQRSVRGHLILKAAEKKRVGAFQARTSQDFIRGKGSGLFILLHGVPGVGKTATAEAVAQTLGKPLFKITCGDLGLTPEQVEASLRAIFRLASLWDTILLLDEVDTFFSQRSKGDGAITKNALVSVFLRILDYYSGILLMTTNRAGALDEAFKSRIHYKIYYPPLNKQQTLEIWKINLDRVRRMEEDEWNARRDSRGDIVDEEDFEHDNANPLALTRALRKPMYIPDEEILAWAEMQFDLSKKPLNGRQIRNAVQVAKALAYADAEAEAEQLELEALALHGGQANPVPVIIPFPRLRVEHFEMIQELTVEFDDYIEAVYSGMDDAQLAAEREDRVDYFSPGPFFAVESAHRQVQTERRGWESDTLPPSRPHSRGRSVGGLGPARATQVGVHGVTPSSHSPRIPSSINSQVYGGNRGSWVSGTNLAVPSSGSGGDHSVPGLGVNMPNVGIHLQQQLHLQQQKQYEDSDITTRSPASPPFHSGNVRGGQHYIGNRLNQEAESAISDNGPLPGQTPLRQTGINNPQRNASYGHHSGSVGSQGPDGESNYTFSDGGGVAGQDYLNTGRGGHSAGGGQPIHSHINIYATSEADGIRGGDGSQLPRGIGQAQGGGHSASVMGELGMMN